MAKTNSMVSIDTELKDKAKMLRINISKVTNDVLRNLVSSYVDEDIDIYEIQKELDLIDAKLLELHTRKTELVTKITSFEEKRHQAQQQDLKEQIKMAESIKRSGLL